MSRAMRVMLAALVAIALACVLAQTAFAVTITPEGYTPPPIRVAVVRSQTTLDWLTATGREDAYPHSTKEKTVLAYLQGRGYNVTQIIGDSELLDTARLERDFDVVVLPAMYAMGRGASDSLVQYVAAGGGIVSMNGSPRVDPAHAPPPGTPNDMREWWWRVMGSNNWEWGPLTAVYQMRMVDDNFTPVFRVNPNTSSPIVIGASHILTARGYNGSGAGMGLLRTPGAGLELNYPVQGGQSVSTYTILDSSVKSKYGGTYHSAISASYGKGRSVYFAYGVNDFLVNYNTALGSILSSTGVPQGEIAGAYLESAIQWVHQDSVTAAITSLSPSPATTDTPVTFAGRATDSSGHAITAWQWRSSIDGVLGSAPTFSKTLTPGIHAIYLKAECSQGTWSPEVGTWLVVGDAGTKPLPLYRFYNNKTGTHFYTASEAERDSVQAHLASTYTLEGVAFAIDAASPQNDAPLYRFFNVRTGTHFYTASEAEKDTLIATLSKVYHYDGPVCDVSLTSAGAQPVYRFYDFKRDVHFYTASTSERDSIVAHLGYIYRYEGVAYYFVQPW